MKTVVKRYGFKLIILMLLGLQGCGHPKDKTHIDDIIHCGFGKEYVSGYTRSDGREVDGYCRDSN